MGNRLIGFAAACALAALAACGGKEPAQPGAASGNTATDTAPAAAPSGPFTGLRIVKVRRARGAERSTQLWTDVPSLDVPLLPQQLAMPQLKTATVPRLSIQALHDGQTIAFRLRWQDRTEDLAYEQDMFPDGCAIQLPLEEGAAQTMGHAGGRVHILHWKALWQRDVDKGFQDVQHLHPNYWTDHYWFAEGGWPHPVPAAFQDPRSHAWFPAMQAKNPMSEWNRKQPVQELVAEGFGTATVRDSTNTRARGIYSGGEWFVAFSRPLVTEDPADHAFGRSPAQVSFAVWEGSSDNVGGRKQYAEWIPYRLEGLGQ